MVRNVAELAGIRKRTYPHMLRHSYARWSLNRGMNPIMLAQVLGHSSLVMIQRTYAHSTPADAHELMSKLLGEEAAGRAPADAAGAGQTLHAVEFSVHLPLDESATACHEIKPVRHAPVGDDDGVRAVDPCHAASLIDEQGCPVRYPAPPSAAWCSTGSGRCGHDDPAAQHGEQRGRA